MYVRTYICCQKSSFEPLGADCANTANAPDNGVWRIEIGVNKEPYGGQTKREMK